MQRVQFWTDGESLQFLCNLRKIQTSIDQIGTCSIDLNDKITVLLPTKL